MDQDLTAMDLVSVEWGSDRESAVKFYKLKYQVSFDIEDIKSAHPFWGYPFSDVSVVHNGQLTNYWNNRRALENKGMRFMSECDSELIAVYLAEKMRSGASLEEGMKESLTGLDGVFTYFVATKDSLGMAKDTMAAKPLVLYESDELVAMGSEEIAIRSILPQEIDTYDPFDGEVKVWQI